MGHASKSDANALIYGETGTGKELFAKAIHLNSNRCSNPFITIDCTSLPHSLAESILFGHVKGAFTGADKSHDGLVKQADQGTLFLDEIGELPLALQKKLLRVLQEKKFRPVGSKMEIKSNFRLVSATNKDLEERVNSGKFRQDLLFRLRTFIIELPPLRERKKDINALAAHYVEKFCRDYHFEVKNISEDFLDMIEKYSWPGNIREFISAMESAVVVDPFSKILFSKHLPDYIRVKAVAVHAADSGITVEQIKSNTHLTQQTLKDYRTAGIARIEKEYLDNLMTQTNWNIQQACGISGLKRAGLYQLLKMHDISK
jgi:two-component system NtrC family response regulator